MKFEKTPLSGSYIIEPEPRVDKRGWFSRVFCKKEFLQIDHQKEWVQINHSFTIKKGSIRGLHFQLPPFSEIKLVRCISGSVYDVIVDIRKQSPTFLHWFGVELSSENKRMIYIPEGFAHGFQTLTDNCELIYHHSAFFEARADAGLNYADKELNISWPLNVTEMSDRDKSHPMLNHEFKGI